MTETEELDLLRSEIDKIDKELIEKIAERISLMPKIATAKNAKGISTISDPEREKQVLAERKKIARELDVSEELVEKVFKELICECKKIQQKEFGKIE